MWEKFKLILKDIDLRRKFLYVLGFLAIFRLISSVPIPGIDAEKLRQFFEANQFFGLLNLFSGGTLSNLSIMMLGVGPYITATIIMQLLTMISPRLKAYYYEEGAVGRAKFNRISRYITVPLAALQGYGFMNLLKSQGVLGSFTLVETMRNMLVITAGTMILVWLGELITEKKIGNG